MASNAFAKTLKALHKPSSPVVFANIWDVASFNTLLSLNTSESQPVKAVATASWAVAATNGIKDEELTAEKNLAAIRKIAPAVREANLPLSVDIQDGYGSQIEQVVTDVVNAGAVGANIEDAVLATGGLYPIDEQVKRLKAALRAAADAGCPDFVLNARCDIFRLPDMSAETRMEEAVKRGKAYLEAGAATVFYWGGISRVQVENLVKELGGRVAVLLAKGPDALSATDLAKIGVARISVGPSMYLIGMSGLKDAALKILTGGRLEG